MSNLKIGDIEKPVPWKLIARDGRVELYENLQTGKWGVYLYEHEGMDEHWLAWSIRNTEDAAREVFDTIARLLHH